MDHYGANGLLKKKKRCPKEELRFDIWLRRGEKRPRRGQNSPVDCFVPCVAASHPAATKYQSAVPPLGCAFSFSAARSRCNDPL